MVVPVFGKLNGDVVILRITVVNGGFVSVDIGVVVDRSGAVVVQSNNEATKAKKRLIATRIMTESCPSKADLPLYDGP